MHPRNQLWHSGGRNWVRGCPLKGRKSSVLQGSRGPPLPHLAASGVHALLSLHPQELLTKAKLVVVLGALYPDHTHTHTEHCLGLRVPPYRKDTDESGGVEKTATSRDG